MVKLESLKKSNQFKKALKEKKIHSGCFSIFAAKNFSTDINILDIIKGNISPKNLIALGARFNFSYEGKNYSDIFEENK